MQKFSQKYTIAYLFEPHPNNFVFTMKNWPLHITLADVFAINLDIDTVINELAKRFSDYPFVQSNAINDEWFGDNNDVHVRLIQKNDALQKLHEDIVEVLGMHGVEFNNPEYICDGFKPHSTIKGEPVLREGDNILIDSFSIIDMFPDEDPSKRKILATIHLKK